MKMKNERKNKKKEEAANRQEENVADDKDRKDRKRKLESIGLTNYEPDPKKVCEHADVERLCILKNRWDEMSEEERNEHKDATFHERRRMVFSTKADLVDEMLHTCP